MLNKPKFLSPSINMYGNNVIDLNLDDIPFSCIVDGNEAITAWQIVISRLSDSSIVLDTGKQELESYFYPINNRNQNVTFNINLKEYLKKIVDGDKLFYGNVILNTSTAYSENKIYCTYDETKDEYTTQNYSQIPSDWYSIFNSLYVVEFMNHREPYYWHITFWGTSETVIDSVDEVFYANTTPKTSIYYSYDNDIQASEEFDLSKINTLTKRSVYFKATYLQDEYVSLKRYGWRLTDTNSGAVILDTITQSQIYGTKDQIVCNYNGFINKSDYLLELYIETQNGFFNILNQIEFAVDYPVKNIGASFDISVLNNTSGIMLNWGNLKTTEGVANGLSVKYTSNLPVVSYDENENDSGSKSVSIPYYSNISFEGAANGKDLDIDENSYIVLSLQFDKSQSRTLFEIIGKDDLGNNISRKLDFVADPETDKRLEYTVVKDDTIVCASKQLSNKISELSWYIVTMCPLFSDNGNYTILKVVESLANNGLFPEDNLYPSSQEDTTTIQYPSLGEWMQNQEGVI